MYSRFLPITALCFLTFVVQSCARTPTPPPRNFTTSDLVIQIDQMPPDWFVSLNVRPTTQKFGQEDGSEVTFATRATPGGMASHQVLRYGSIFQSALKFDKAVEEFYPPPPHVISGWRVPQELSYKSPFANQFYFACAEVAVATPSGKASVCVATAQYEEYLSIFGTGFVDGYMSYADLERILRYIDAEMAARLEKTPVPSQTP